MSEGGHFFGFMVTIHSWERMDEESEGHWLARVIEYGTYNEVVMVLEKLGTIDRQVAACGIYTAASRGKMDIIHLMLKHGAKMTDIDRCHIGPLEFVLRPPRDLGVVIADLAELTPLNRLRMWIDDTAHLQHLNYYLGVWIKEVAQTHTDTIRCIMLWKRGHLPNVTRDVLQMICEYILSRDQVFHEPSAADTTEPKVKKLCV